jgi:hypothetical protein
MTGPEAEHSPTANDEFQSEWRCSSTPHKCLRGVYINSFTVTLKILADNIKMYVKQHGRVLTGLIGHSVVANGGSSEHGNRTSSSTKCR